MAVTKDQVVEFLKGMSVIDLADFVKELEEIFGVSAAAPAAMMMSAPAAGGGAAAAAEQTEFEVILTKAGDQKVQVIKVVREVVAGLGLKEAKAVVDEAPKSIKAGVTKAEAEEIVKKVAEAGGTAEIK